ncbi:MAG: signal peptidase I, partial [Acidobacteriales bacterium]|nr:signal peptidase I [Terriglobales bacterium]
MSVAQHIPQSVPEIDAPKRAHAVHRHSSWPGSLQALLTTIMISVFVITFVVQAFQIPSDSMENTLLIGDYLLVDKVHFGSARPGIPVLPYREIKRNDIVVFRYPVHPEEHFVKRVIGLPGDRIKLVDGRVRINGNFLIEPYII